MKRSRSNHYQSYRLRFSHFPFAKNRIEIDSVVSKRQLQQARARHKVHRTSPANHVYRINDSKVVGQQKNVMKYFSFERKLFGKIIFVIHSLSQYNLWHYYTHRAVVSTSYFGDQRACSYPLSRPMALCFQDPLRRTRLSLL